MATSGPTNIPSFFNTDADFRAWGAAINAALTAIGLVQTADTGQINWATVTKPAAINTAAGYEIWRFNDALQATKPVFIKIEYGSGAVVDRPSLWITTGSVTNGAGTLSGQSRARIQLGAGTSDAAGSTRAMYVSGSSSRLCMILNVNTVTAAQNMAVMIERTKDSTGADTGDGLIVIQWAGSGGASYTTVPLTPGVAVPAATANTPTVDVTGKGGTSIIGTDVALSPLLAFVGKALFGMSLIVYNSADIGALGSFVANHLGANHTYLPLGSLVSSVGANWSTPTGTNAFAMLWE